MFEFLASLAFYQLIIFTIVIIATLGGTIYVLLKALSKMNFSFRNRKGFVIQNTKENRNALQNIGFLITKIIDNIEKRNYIEYIDTIRSAMSSIEEMLLSFKKIRENRFLKELRGKVSSEEQRNVAMQEDFKYYSFVLEYHTKIIIDRFRQFIRDNGISEMDEGEYVNYYTSKIDTFLNMEDEIFNNIYFGTRKIDRSELYALHREKESEVRKLYTDTFTMIRKITIKKKKEKENLKKELEDIIQNYIDTGSIDLDNTAGD